MYGLSGNYNVESNVTRLIEETVNSVEDVERRLTGLKVGIAQTFPHLAPILSAREVQHRDQTAFALGRLVQGVGSFSPSIGNLGIGIPSIQGLGVQGLGIQGLGFPQAFAPTLGMQTPFSPLSSFPGVPPQFGALTGGIGSPFGGAFRPW